MSWRFNPPPTWPAPPPGWMPPPGWTPDPSWPPAPDGWQFWIQDLEAPTSAPPPGGWPPQSPPRRTGGAWLLLLLVALVILALVAVGIGLVANATRSTTTQELVTETTAAAVRVENECGPISLREGPAGAVSTRATVKYSRSAPEVTSQLEGGVVVVQVQCATFSVFGFGSSASLVVDVPPDGTVEARSSAGSVTAERLSSDLILHSSAGSVSTVDVTSKVVAADSSAGSVSLAWAGAADPTTITARSSAGSVRVSIPDVAGVAYRVEADSSAGSVSVDVRTDPQSDRSIRATSSAGSVRVEYR